MQICPRAAVAVEARPDLEATSPRRKSGPSIGTNRYFLFPNN
jgi:hypothetical protein